MIHLGNINVSVNNPENDLEPGRRLSTVNLREEATLKIVRRAEAQLGTKMTLKTVHGKEGCHKYREMPTIGTPCTGNLY